MEAAESVRVGVHLERVDRQLVRRQLELLEDLRTHGERWVSRHGQGARQMRETRQAKRGRFGQVVCVCVQF